MRGLLEGKTVIVTGGTRGIGRSIVQGCAAEGANVVFSGRDEGAARQVVNETGCGAHFVKADLAGAEACFALVDAAVARFGRLDGLVNNAGVFPSGSLLNTPVETLDLVLSVNIRAAFLLCQRAVSYMMKTGGAIVNIGSTHAGAGSPGLAAYAVSKGALRTLTSHIAHNYVSAGIRANWITVGWVLTEGDYAVQRANGLDDAQIRAGAKSKIPSGRYQDGAEIADAAVFLLSDKSKSHTDTDMRVTGGFIPAFGMPAGIGCITEGSIE